MVALLGSLIDVAICVACALVAVCVPLGSGRHRAPRGDEWRGFAAAAAASSAVAWASGGRLAPAAAAVLGLLVAGSVAAWRHLDRGNAGRAVVVCALLLAGALGLVLTGLTRLALTAQAPHGSVVATLMRLLVCALVSLVIVDVLRTRERIRAATAHEDEELEAEVLPAIRAGTGTALPSARLGILAVGTAACLTVLVAVAPPVGAPGRTVAPRAAAASHAEAHLPASSTGPDRLSGSQRPLDESARRRVPASQDPARATSAALPAAAPAAAPAPTSPTPPVVDPPAQPPPAPAPVPVEPAPAEPPAAPPQEPPAVAPDPGPPQPGEPHPGQGRPPSSGPGRGHAGPPSHAQVPDHATAAHPNRGHGKPHRSRGAAPAA